MTNEEASFHGSGFDVMLDLTDNKKKAIRVMTFDSGDRGLLPSPRPHRAMASAGWRLVVDATIWCCHGGVEGDVSRM